MSTIIRQQAGHELISETDTWPAWAKYALVRLSIPSEVTTVGVTPAEDVSYVEEVVLGHHFFECLESLVSFFPTAYGLEGMTHAEVWKLNGRYGLTKLHSI
jgi:hypothetical protein